ncbi:MAG: O-antigen ligase family protein [Cryobacterium sp.]|nr:O-antigen ligase family protein [Cryobacterium sp.]
MLESPRFRLGFASLVLFTLLAGDAWRLSLGWWFFSILTIALTLIAGWLLWLQRARWSVGRMPLPLLAFLVLATVSIFWSHYPGATALGLFTTWIIVVNAVALAVTFTWAELLRALGLVLRFVIAASLVFELFVSVVLRHRLLPFFGQPGVDYESYTTIPGMLMWSRNQLFDVFGSGRIQGIVGNANSLGFLALLALIVFGIQFASRSASRRSGVVWIALAAATILMTKSATVTVAAAGVLVVLVVALFVRRAHTGLGRAIVYATSIAVLLAGAASAFIFRNLVFELLGKSPDLTGRLGIWSKVIDLTQQRPAFGWGWVSYWVPWADPFNSLVFRSGVRQLQAHNTWLDVAFQVGLVGLVVFAALVGAALVKAWQHAVDRPQRAPGQPLRHPALTLLPLLVLVALVVQSFAESRLITEYGLALLIVVAVKTKRRELL